MPGTAHANDDNKGMKERPDRPHQRSKRSIKKAAIDQEALERSVAEEAHRRHLVAQHREGGLDEVHDRSGPFEDRHEDEVADEHQKPGAPHLVRKNRVDPFRTGHPRLCGSGHHGRDDLADEPVADLGFLHLQGDRATGLLAGGGQCLGISVAMLGLASLIEQGTPQLELRVIRLGRGQTRFGGLYLGRPTPARLRRRRANRRDHRRAQFVYARAGARDKRHHRDPETLL